MAAQPTQLFPQTNAYMASIRTLQQVLTNSSRPNALCHQNVFSSPRISHERAFGQVVNGGSAEQNQGGFSRNVAHVGRAHISPTMLPNETEPKTRRVYADLNPEQERVLLKKANHFRSSATNRVKVSSQINCFSSLLILSQRLGRTETRPLKAWGIKGCE